MYCTKCGQENSDDAKVCRSCGAVLSKAAETVDDRFPKTSGLAIAAFVLALLSIVFFPVGLAAIILGIISVVIIEKSGSRLTGRIFAVLGIIVPVVLFLLIFVFMIALIPALRRVKHQAQTVTCMTKLKQWGLILKLYSDDNNGYFFSDGGDDVKTWWMEPLQPYYRDNKQLFLCPSALQTYTEGDPNTSGVWKIGDDLGCYGLNGWICNPGKGHTELRGRGPAENYWRNTYVKRAGYIPVLLDAMWLEGWPRQDDKPPPDEDWFPMQVNKTKMKANENEMRRFCINRHQGYINGLFMDWSSRKVGLKELWKLKWHRDYDTEGPWTMAGGTQPSDWPEWMRKFKDY